MKDLVEYYKKKDREDLERKHATLVKLHNLYSDLERRMVYRMALSAQTHPPDLHGFVSIDRKSGHVINGQDYVVWHILTIYHDPSADECYTIFQDGRLVYNGTFVDLRKIDSGGSISCNHKELCKALITEAPKFGISRDEITTWRNELEAIE